MVRNYDLHVKVCKSEKDEATSEAKNAGQSTSQLVRELIKERTLNKGDSLVSTLKEVHVAITSLNTALKSIMDRDIQKDQRKRKSYHDNALYDPNKTSEIYSSGRDIYGQSHSEDV